MLLFVPSKKDPSHLSMTGPYTKTSIKLWKESFVLRSAFRVLY